MILNWLKKLGKKTPPLRPAAIPVGQRVYAIGDVHGRIDLVKMLINMILDDCADYKGVVTVVFLGDYIDRGPHSREVIEYLMEPLPAPLNAVCLLGNHEEKLAEFITTGRHGPGWLTYGGLETLRSYGIPGPTGVFTPERIESVRESLLKEFPTEHLEWMRNLPSCFESGDYYFVHAGIYPPRPLGEQTLRAKLWIREEFLDWDKPLEKIIVHGHTISEDVEVRIHRIGIDTGAYATECLTAIALEGTLQRIIQTPRN